MTDRDVLELALNDQREAQARIDELRQQIATEEERIASSDAFIATYREYEARLNTPDEGAVSDSADAVDTAGGAFGEGGSDAAESSATSPQSTSPSSAAYSSWNS
jgi:hypothetical protein